MNARWPRIALVIACVVTLAWLGVLLRDHLVGQAASDRLRTDSTLSRAEFEVEMRRLRSADLLNPGRPWKLVRIANRFRYSPSEAARMLETLVLSEPENVAAWRGLSVTTRTIDPARSRAARARARRLDPLADAD